ncbi:MAG: 5-formyltetrahydrofolate cyclo-ligase [Desulfonatronovibrio sp. MSAO_Bac4]|nr:MAG: 5-formyltetrahydrofolate cyclo-ligase [Desulfonatronovibrio sp. MSAO_Bac4]
MTKNDYRQKISSLRLAMSQGQVSEKSSKISRVFLNWIDLDKYQSFLVYLPIKNEVDTKPLIENLLQTGKKIYAPRCSQEHSGCMDFYMLSDLSELSPGYCGIAEPCSNSSALYVNTGPSVCILPGLAFDHQGQRLGYGHGFFDRYLRELPGPKPLLIGFAYDFQVVDALPGDDWDVPVDAVITDKRVVASKIDY